MAVKNKFGKKGFFFTFISILIVALFLLVMATMFDLGIEQEKFIVKSRVELINDFINDFDSIYLRNIVEVSAYNVLQDLTYYVGDYGYFASEDDFIKAFNSSLIEGKIGDEVRSNVQDYKLNHQLQVVKDAMKDISKINFDFEIVGARVYQDEDPFQVFIEVEFSYFVDAGVAKWNRSGRSIVLPIEIYGLNNPIYMKEKSYEGPVTIYFGKTEGIVNSGYMTGLSYNVTDLFITPPGEIPWNVYLASLFRIDGGYRRNNKAPNYLKRFYFGNVVNSGKIISNESGIETFIPSFITSSYVPARVRSNVDYCFFHDIISNVCPSSGLEEVPPLEENDDDIFYLDDDHIEYYRLEDIHCDLARNEERNMGQGTKCEGVQECGGNSNDPSTWTWKECVPDDINVRSDRDCGVCCTCDYNCQPSAPVNNQDEDCYVGAGVGGNVPDCNIKECPTFAYDSSWDRTIVFDKTNAISRILENERYNCPATDVADFYPTAEDSSCAGTYSCHYPACEVRDCILDDIDDDGLSAKCGDECPDDLRYVNMTSCVSECNSQGCINDCGVICTGDYEAGGIAHGECNEGDTQSCGVGSCYEKSSQTCVDGQWGECNSPVNTDCGICCKCVQGSPTYDEYQNQDCADTICPDDGCGKGGCGTNIFGNYLDVAVSNECIGLFDCTQNTCNVECEDDTDNDGFSISCEDCDDTNYKVNPMALELCDDEDNNCDGEVDTNCIDCVYYYCELFDVADVSGVPGYDSNFNYYHFSIGHEPDQNEINQFKDTDVEIKKEDGINEYWEQGYIIEYFDTAKFFYVKVDKSIEIDVICSTSNGYYFRKCD
ncbi:putative metal-binding motif-containing protein [Nanoarchaeota archaeon]